MNRLSRLRSSDIVCVKTQVVLRWLVVVYSKQADVCEGHHKLITPGKLQSLPEQFKTSVIELEGGKGNSNYL